VTLCAFDLLELDGVKVAIHKLIDRKMRLQNVLAKVRDGIHFNEHIEGEGPTIFAHAASWAARVSSLSEMIWLTKAAARSDG
jgi:ATP-dependent DNA ligase